MIGDKYTPTFRMGARVSKVGDSLRIRMFLYDDKAAEICQHLFVDALGLCEHVIKAGNGKPRSDRAHLLVFGPSHCQQSGAVKITALANELDVASALAGIPRSDFIAVARVRFVVPDALQTIHAATLGEGFAAITGNVGRRREWSEIGALGVTGGDRTTADRARQKVNARA